MIPIHLLIAIVEAVPPLVRALDRAGDAWAARRRERRAMREDGPCPACADDPADRCDACGRRRSRVEA